MHIIDIKVAVYRDDLSVGTGRYDAIFNGLCVLMVVQNGGKHNGNLPHTYLTVYINDENVHIHHRHMYVTDGGINFNILTTLLTFFSPISMILGI